MNQCNTFWCDCPDHFNNDYYGKRCELPPKETEHKFMMPEEDDRKSESVGTNSGHQYTMSVDEEESEEDEKRSYL